MSNTSSSSGGGIGFCGLLAILFIGLKLTGHITWSWLWVLSPLWIPLVIVLSLLGLFLAGWLLIAAVTAAIAASTTKKLRK
jgi:hypothetical protein